LTLDVPSADAFYIALKAAEKPRACRTNFGRSGAQAPMAPLQHACCLFRLLRSPRLMKIKWRS